MTEQEQSPIRFSIEEVILLDQEADVARIVSLDLEPNVKVYEKDGLVHIQGDLVLEGSMLPEGAQEDALDLESSSLADQLKFKPLNAEQQEIYERNSIGKIEKKFPVDVTVPADKISRMEDVYVDVEQFDYSVEDGNGLNIKAEITLLGVNQGLRVDNTSSQPSEAEIRQAAQAISRDSEAAYVHDEQTNETYSASIEHEPAIEDAGEPVHAVQTNFYAADRVDDTKAEAEQADDETERDSKEPETNFLSQLMSAHDEDQTERWSRLKVCIIQNGESLQTISERYEVSTSDIMRLNHLEHEQVNMGQILYIPDVS